MSWTITHDRLADASCAGRPIPSAKQKGGIKRGAMARRGCGTGVPRDRLVAEFFVGEYTGHGRPGLLRGQRQQTPEEQRCSCHGPALAGHNCWPPSQLGCAGAGAWRLTSTGQGVGRCCCRCWHSEGRWRLPVVTTGPIAVPA